MEAKSNGFLYLSKCFHTLHLCVTIALIVAVVYIQLRNEARFGKLELQRVDLPQRKHNTDTDFEARRLVKRNAFMAKQGDINVTSKLRTKHDKDLHNDTTRNTEEVFGDSKRKLLTCLDLLLVFIKVGIELRSCFSLTDISYVTLGRTSCNRTPLFFKMASCAFERRAMSRYLGAS